MKTLINIFSGLRKFVPFIMLFISGSVAFAQTEKQLVIGEQPLYRVAKASAAINIDGRMDEADWQKAEVRSFDYFYRGDKPAEKQKTKFRMMWDDQNLYLFYECEDTSLTARETAFDARPYLDDCAEFFCVPVPDSIYLHFGFELNITKAPYDFVALWRFHNERTIFIRGYNPEYKVEVVTNGTINNQEDKDRGWTMELAIPFNAFSDFHMVARPAPGVKWAFQAVRQDRNFVDDRFRSTSTIFPIYDIRKDVHQPSRFGLMEFADK